MNFLIKGVSGFGKVIRGLTKKDTTPLWKEMKLPPPPHGDFRPDLLQETTIWHFWVPMHQKWTDSVRVRMATRKLKVEENTKYIPSIHQIVEEKTKQFYKKDEVDMSEHSVNEIKSIIPEIINSLSYNVFLQEHRLRYQQEQRIRHVAAYKKFNSNSYLWQNRSIDQFIKDYNCFLWCEIKKSHFNMSPKIESNYRRNYHEGEVSPVTSLIFYLYFKTDKVKRFFSKLLLAAYRNPYSDKQKSIVH